MKKIGIIIFAIGLLITIYTGFNFVTKKKIVDVGEIQITQDKNHTVTWSPLVGVAVMVVGGGMFLVGQKKS
ncbi:MAG: hypothetical protein R3D00_00300 [Bacteroidia bacterium]